MPDNPLSQQTPSSSLDLSSITEEFLRSPEVTGAQAATPPVQEAQEAAPTGQEEVTPPLQATPAQELPPDPEEQQKGYMREKDYRQKTMSLADERRAFDAEKQQLNQRLTQAEQYAQQVHQHVNDPAFLQHQWNLIHAQVQAQDPNHTPTVQQVNALLQEQLANTKQEVAQYVHRLEVQRNAAQFDQERALYAQTLLKEFPTLEDQDGIERLISEAAWKRAPANMNELKQFMKEDAETRHKKVQKRIDDNAQAAIMRQAKASKPGIEPQGGKVPVIQPTQRKLKLGSSDLLSDTVEWLKQQG